MLAGWHVTWLRATASLHGGKGGSSKWEKWTVEGGTTWVLPSPALSGVKGRQGGHVHTIGCAQVNQPGRCMGVEETVANGKNGQGRVVPHGYYPPLLSVEQRGGGKALHAPLGARAVRLSLAGVGKNIMGGYSPVSHPPVPSFLCRPSHHGPASIRNVIVGAVRDTRVGRRMWRRGLNRCRVAYSSLLCRLRER